MNNLLHIYTRVSSAIQQEDGTSLDTQRQMGLKKALEMGFEAKIWNEGGQSSFFDDLNNRPVLVSLLTQIEAGHVKHLFVYNTDRLSRNQRTWAVIRYKLLTHGVTLHTASGQMKLQNPVDDLMLGILSEISQYDNRIRSERSRIGRFHKIQQGNWKGGPPPYGYCLKDKKLEIDPFESEWVKKVYDWYTNGVSIKTIQHRLNTSGVLTRRGNTKWSLGSIQLMLRSTVYGGYYDYHDKMIGETVRIQAPVIIDAATLDQTRNRRQFNKQSVGPVKHFYLLRRLLWCGHCGLVMGVRSNKREDGHYYCVSSERLWKDRDQDHPKWQRGASCSAVRSIKIRLTNQYVWKVAQQLHEFIDKHQPSQHLFIGPHLPHRRDSNSLPSEQYRTELANDLESVDEVTQREIIKTTVSRITVFYDTDSKKHRLRLTLTEQVTRCLQAIDDTTASVTAESFGNSCDSLTLSEHSHRVVATVLRSQSQSECDVKGVDHHGGVTGFNAANSPKPPQPLRLWC